MGKVKRFKKPAIFLFVVLIIALAIASFFYLNSQPDTLSQAEKEKALTKILGRKANTQGEKTGNIAYSGKYASFVYPAKAKIYKYVDPGAKKNKYIVERLSFDIENPRLILNYTVENNPPNSTLDDYPAVKLRDDPSSGYKKSEFDADEEAGVAFSKPGSGENRAEKMGFVLRNNLIYTISITGNNEKDISELFDLIIESFTFN